MAALAKYPKLIYYKNVRRFILKAPFVFFFLLILLFFRFDNAYAKFEIIAIPEADPQPTSLMGENWEEWGSSINENTKLVKITFSNLSTKISYKACLKRDPKDCSGGDNLKDLPTQPVNGSVDLFVCGDGDEDLKFADRDTSGCDNDIDNGDYFHEQVVYSLSLFNKEAPTATLETASFYVYRYYPEVSIQPDKPSPGIPFQVVLKGTRRPHGSDRMNNYLVRLNDIRNDTLDRYCLVVHEDNKNEITYSEAEDASEISFAVPEGDYVLKIEEQENEQKKFFRFDLDRRHHECGGGFVYYQAVIKVREGGGSIGELIADPDGRDLAAGFGKEHKGPPPPCDEKIDKPGQNCPKVQTAIGAINTSPAGFVKSVFSLVLGLAGGLAILLIIYSGFQLIESRGNPEKLEAAREQLTSAIIGLLFIIFSLVIIQAIGVDILNLPGFGR